MDHVRKCVYFHSIKTKRKCTLIPDLVTSAYPSLQQLHPKRRGNYLSWQMMIFLRVKPTFGVVPHIIEIVWSAKIWSLSNHLGFSEMGYDATLFGDNQFGHNSEANKKQILHRLHQ